MTEVNFEQTILEKIEALEARVERLGQFMEEIDDDYALLAHRLNAEMLQHQDQLNQYVTAESNKLYVLINKTLADLRVRFQEKVQDEMRRVTADEVAKALTKQILVVRQANREEAKAALVVRSATPTEIRNQNQNQQAS